MRLRIYHPRILAIDLRPTRFAYALFEGPKLLLDYGMGAYPDGEGGRVVAAGKRFAGLLNLCSPAAVVVKRERWVSSKTDPSEPSTAKAIAREASAHSIPVHLLGEKELRATYRNLGCETKYQMASALTRVFPELLWKLPSERRIWQSEHPRMSLFDAIGLGLAYWQHETTELSPPSDLS